MPASGSALGRAVPTPYALPADALEGLLRLASHVALTEAAVAFLRDDDHVWVLASSGISAGSAHAAALLLPDVLQEDADELLCLDLAAAGDALSLMGTALVTLSFLPALTVTVLKMVEQRQPPAPSGRT